MNSVGSNAEIIEKLEMPFWALNVWLVMESETPNSEARMI